LESSGPLDTFSSCSTRGLYITWIGTEYTFCPPARFTFTVKVEPTAWSSVGGSKLTMALPTGAEAVGGCVPMLLGAPAGGGTAAPFGGAILFCAAPGPLGA